MFSTSHDQLSKKKRRNEGFKSRVGETGGAGGQGFHLRWETFDLRMLAMVTVLFFKFVKRRAMDHVVVKDITTVFLWCAMGRC